MQTHPMRLGIISALHQEQDGLFLDMHNAKHTEAGMRNYVQGNLWEIDCVCVLSRIGKVAAATTVATLIERFNVSHVVFTGVAGAIGDGIRVGDVVVAESLLQHDMDASPLFPRHEVPLLGLSRFATDRNLTENLLQAAKSFVQNDFEQVIDQADRDSLKLKQPAIHHGLIASGDQFIHQKAKADELRGALPDLLAVEMEGAAVAQVCLEFGLPFAVIRTISDGSNEQSAMDFTHFVEKVAARYALHVIRHLCKQLAGG